MQVRSKRTEYRINKWKQEDAQAKRELGFWYNAGAVLGILALFCIVFMVIYIIG